MMNSKDILSMDARSLSLAIKSKKITCVQVMESVIDRIDQMNKKHNAIILMCGSKDDLLELARNADETPRKGWLHGIPIAIKDLSNVKNIQTSFGGSPLYEDFVPDESDLFVHNIEDAGALIIGKTNSPEGGLGSHTYNDRWGATSNPFNKSKSSGGSSGGAAVAVSTGMLCLADGSDMMGSLRNPAGWNNLYSFRPTAGIVPNNDITSERNPLPYPISTPGPIARNPTDCALLLETMAGKNNFNASEFFEHDDSTLNTRLGWLGDWNGDIPFEDDILLLCRNALMKVLEREDKVVVEDVNNQNILEQMPHADLWQAWNFVRFALTAEKYTSSFDTETLLGESSKIKEELQWEIKQGLSVSDNDLDRAKQVNLKYSTFLDKLFKKYDVLALPSAQVWPFEVSQKYPTSIADVRMDTYHRWMEVCVPVSFGGLPCLTVPAGFNEDGLPIGIQLFSKRGEDLKLFRLALIYHKLTDWPSKVEWFEDANFSLRCIKKREE